MIPHTIAQGNYNFPRNTNKIQFFDEISTSGKKVVDLMKDLKYEHQSIFPLWGRVKLNFRDRYGKPNIYSKNSSCCKVFFTGLSKNDFGIILQTLTHQKSTSKRPTAAAGSESELPWVETELKAETSMVIWSSKVPGVNTSPFCVKLKCLTAGEISKYSQGKTTLTQPQVCISEARKLKVRSSSTSKHPKDLLPSHSSISSADPSVTRSKTQQSNIEKQQRRKITGCPSEQTNTKQFTFQLCRHVLQKRKSKITLRCQVKGCKLAYRIFSSVKDHNTHHRVYHSTIKYHCTNCQKYLATPSTYRWHRYTHGPESYKCSTCNKTFTYKSKLHQHR